MRVVLGCAAVIAVALLVGACSEDRPPEARAARSVASDHAAPGPALPDGWRWEGFGGVLVGVPGDWAWGNSSQRIGQWCVGDEPLTPMMGRPGPSSLVGCLGKQRGVDPSTLVANTGIVVELSPALEGSGDSAEGDQVVRRIGDVTVRVNGPAHLRDRILATVHRADVDGHGCAMFLRTTAADRPDPPRDVTSLTDVVSVAACRYSVPPPGEVTRTGAALPLFSSLLLQGDAAGDAIAAIAAAPAGGGPDNPGSCLAEWSYGDEFLVLQVESAEGTSTLRVRYSGCDHNGFDDGVTVRALTRAAVQPLVADANVPFSWSGGGAKTKIMRP